MWVKLSNSGDPLKLLVPSYSWKTICGWSNYSGFLLDYLLNNLIDKVTSQKIIERAMGYRGTKSVTGLNKPTSQTKSVTVKAQRVDGSWCIKPAVNKNLMHLRYTLMGFERGYQTRIPSNQINIRRLTTIHIPHNQMNPWFLTGFSDAEGSFSILVQHNIKYNTNWIIKAVFAIGLHKKDTAILEKIQTMLGVGNIHKHGKDSVQFRVDSIKELQIILDHFDKYPLMSAKIADYILFKKAFNIIKAGEHLNKEGLLKIIGIKASLNLGLSPNLKESFPNFVLVSRPEYSFKEIIHPEWVAGFISGDGSFNIKTSSSISSKLSSRVQLRFGVGLNLRDKELIQGLVVFFNLEQGKHIHTTSDSVHLEISKFTDIVNIIIPFFDKYPIQGIKSLDFADFKKVASIVEDKGHLTLNGYNNIMSIKGGMNKNRL